MTLLKAFHTTKKMETDPLTNLVGQPLTYQSETRDTFIRKRAHLGKLGTSFSWG